ncbi:MAG: hypothetical protein K8R37_14075 [Bacteroidales bacterium]|nr:hypothetical protein [Bacteroidales bacterium]
MERIEECQSQISSVEYAIDGAIQLKANKFTESSDKNNSNLKNIARHSAFRSILYYNIENISDILNALNYGFLNRLVGVVASEPTLGTEIACRQFGGIQLIHNATEALMKDYVETKEDMYLFSIDAILEEENLNKKVFSDNLRDIFRKKKIITSKNPNILKENDKQEQWVINDKGNTYIIRKENEKLIIFEAIRYKGLVVFGFRNRAVTHAPLIIHHPSYAEHDLEYLIILAHEAYHLAYSMESGEIVKKFGPIHRNIQKMLMDTSLASLYLPETIKDKNAPDELIADILADEIMADIYATIVAGEAYLVVLGRYYLPIILDRNPAVQPLYASFVIGSLRIRVVVATLGMMNVGGDVVKKIIKDTNVMIEYWENLSKNIALEQLTKNELNDVNLMNIEDKLISFCNVIVKENIPAKMIKLIERPYYPREAGKRKELQNKLEEVKNILTGEPPPEDMVKIWENDLLTPRHLISLLVHHKEIINRNAILIALGYHKNILDRFRYQRVNSNE